MIQQDCLALPNSLPYTNYVMARFEIEIPFLPPSKNKYDGWQHAWKSGLKKKWKAVLYEQLDDISPCAKVTAQAILIFDVNRRRDWQNYVHPLWHYVADALQDCGIIEDDTPEYFTTKENGGIVFQIEKDKTKSKKEIRRTVLVFETSP